VGLVNVRAYAGWLAFTLFFGAAMHDASPAQEKELRQHFHDHKDGLRHRSPAVWRPALRSFMVSVQETMGADWAPRGEWDAQIKLLVAEPETSMGVSRQAVEHRKAQREGRP
jgi:hypothetical protein